MWAHFSVAAHLFPSRSRRRPFNVTELPPRDPVPSEDNVARLIFESSKTAEPKYNAHMPAIRSEPMYQSENQEKRCALGATAGRGAERCTERCSTLSETAVVASASRLTSPAGPFPCRSALPSTLPQEPSAGRPLGLGRRWRAQLQPKARACLRRQRSQSGCRRCQQEHPSRL